MEDGNLIHNIYVGDKLIAMIGEGVWGQTSAMKTMPGWYAGKLDMERYGAIPMVVGLGWGLDAEYLNRLFLTNQTFLI